MSGRGAARQGNGDNSDLSDWLARVANGEWSWVRNSQCKYVTLKIDTRRGAYAILDRDDDEIDLAELNHQRRAIADRSPEGGDSAASAVADESAGPHGHRPNTPASHHLKG